MGRFYAQMRLLESAEEEANQRIVFCDLNWTRLDNVRFALAQFFDHPASHHNLAKINRVRIDFASAFPIDRCPFCRLACGAIRLASWKNGYAQQAFDSIGPLARRSISNCANEPENRLVKSRWTTPDVEFLVDSRQVRRSFGSFTRKTGRKTHATVNARRKKRSSQPDE